MRFKLKDTPSKSRPFFAQENAAIMSHSLQFYLPQRSHHQNVENPILRLQTCNLEMGYLKQPSWPVPLSQATLDYRGAELPKTRAA